MKTIRQWLEQLPDPHKELALKNSYEYYDSDPEYISKEFCDSMKSALYSAFVWSKTTEGFEYWSSVWLDNIKS